MSFRSSIVCQLFDEIPSRRLWQTHQTHLVSPCHVVLRDMLAVLTRRKKEKKYCSLSCQKAAALGQESNAVVDCTLEIQVLPILVISILRQSRPSGSSSAYFANFDPQVIPFFILIF